jgi:YesN/AraC family two-component response regulator
MNNIVNNKSALIVDDDSVFLEILHTYMKLFGFDPIFQAVNGKDALDVLENETVDLLITDVNMPVLGGVELMRRVRDDGNPVPIIVISGFLRKDHLFEIEPFNVAEIFFKPFKMPLLGQVITKIFEPGKNV